MQMILCVLKKVFDGSVLLVKGKKGFNFVTRLQNHFMRTW